MTDPRTPPDARAAVRAAGARPTTYTLVLNLLPLSYLGLGGYLTFAFDAWAHRAVFALAWVYLLPPLVVRAVLSAAGGCEGSDLDQSARAYKAWWFSTQMQVVFNRLPALEEALRLVPGLYALWLAVWGARVSTKVYWAAGSIVTDRTLVEIGEAVVIGTRAVLAPHLAFKSADGELRVTVARIRIEDEVLIGAYAGIGPGCRIEAGAEVPAASFLRPFTHWQKSRNVRADRPRLRA
jgi:hypothetical protein